MNKRSMVICLLTLVVCALAIPGMAQKTTTGISCAQINALHLMKQDNMRAGLTLIECGIVTGGKPLAGREVAEMTPQPPNVLVSNRSCGSYTSCTKSENMVWGNGSTVVVAYNDHDSSQSNTYGGVSYSTDGGATFTEIEPNPVATGHAQNYGDPIVVYNRKLALWFTGDLVTGCGGQGIGLWSSADGITWTPASCAHNNSADDRESFWVDNDPTSLGYGRMYISFNNFNVGGGALQLVYSDNGTSWNQVTLNGGFIRDVQITGAQISPTTANAALASFNSVFVASMNEGGGGGANRQNVMWRSTNGGASWTSFSMGGAFAPPLDGICSSNSYFAKMNPIWRHMGWGEPAVGPNGVVHYDYAGHGQGSDNGDIFYVRSADNGATWSAPMVLNTDTPGIQYHTQWMPSLSVNPAGKVTASWYDRRSVSSACNVATDPGCNYEIFGRQSPDNGNTWQVSDSVISTSIIPQPEQADGGVQSCYAGDYDYDTASGSSAYATWTDGRRNVGGHNVQDVNLAVVPEQ